jgi:protein-S-isoprenylcysteine O-methyltransferase Ste14
MKMDLILFGILSIPIIFLSRHNLFNVRSHGFYRFLSWECILWLFAANYKYWFDNPREIHQQISWILLILSAVIVFAGVQKMKQAGKAHKSRQDDGLYTFEKTTELVDTGIFRYIRHPLYASLICLTWGSFFKHITVMLFLVSVLSSVFLYITARYDEKECTAYFGDKYTNYMNRSKMFIPYVF